MKSSARLVDQWTDSASGMSPPHEQHRWSIVAVGNCFLPNIAFVEYYTKRVVWSWCLQNQNMNLNNAWMISVNNTSQSYDEVVWVSFGILHSLCRIMPDVFIQYVNIWLNRMNINILIHVIISESILYNWRNIYNWESKFDFNKFRLSRLNNVMHYHSKVLEWLHRTARLDHCNKLQIVLEVFWKR